MLPLIYILLLFSVLLLLFYIEFQRYRLNEQFKHIPGPRQFPIIGNVFAIKKNKITDIKALSEELVTSPIVRLLCFNKMMLLVSDPKLLEQILGSSVFSDRVPFLTNFWKWNESLIMAQYPIWRILRKTVRPSFNQTQLMVNLPVMVKHVEKYESIIEKHAKAGESFDFLDVSLEIAMSLALETLFNCHNKDPCLTHDLYKLIAENFSNRTVRPYLYSDWIYKLTPSYREVVKAYDKLDKIFQSIIDDAELTLIKGKNPIDLLLAARNEGKITVKQLKDTVAFIFNNSYETTAVTTAYTILMLAMHPEVDKKLFQELNQYYKKGETVDNNLLQNLTYMEMVIKETIRLFPIPITHRCNTTDIHINGIGNIPKGTVVIPVFYNLHRWQHIWGADAEQFNPDHFLPESVAKRHPSSFLGFSVGPRMCIGYSHAMTSLKLALIHILSKFRFETDLKYEELNFKLTMTLKCTNGYLVRAYRR